MSQACPRSAKSRSQHRGPRNSRELAPRGGLRPARQRPRCYRCGKPGGSRENSYGRSGGIDRKGSETVPCPDPWPGEDWHPRLCPFHAPQSPLGPRAHTASSFHFRVAQRGLVARSRTAGECTCTVARVFELVETALEGNGVA